MNKHAEIGQMFVSRALDQTKKIRKTAAEAFAKSVPEKPRKKPEKKSTVSPGFSAFHVDLA